MILFAALALAAPPGGVACTARTATPATVADIGENLDRYLGRCVTVSGPASSLALFGSVEGIYRSQRSTAEGNPDAGEARRHRLGLYSENDAIRKLRPGRVSWLTLTGTVDSCERKQEWAVGAAGKDSIVMMRGYCHYYRGAVLDAVAFSIDRSKTARRLTGEAARREVGDLVLAPDDWPHIATLRSAGEEFREALGRGDRAALARMHDMRPGDQDSAFLDGLVAGSESPFAGVRRDPSLPMAVFIRRSDLERVRAGFAPEEPFGTICFARQAGRDIDWPISANDADNDPERPYACTSVVWRDWAARKIGLDTRVSRRGRLAEPDRFD